MLTFHRYLAYKRLRSPFLVGSELAFLELRYVLDSNSELTFDGVGESQDANDEERELHFPAVVVVVSRSESS